MKKFLIPLFMIFGSFLWAGAPMSNVPQIDPFELLNNMDPKELDKLMEDLAKMSPEEIKYYEDLGKQMFKQSGYDLDEIAKTFPAQGPAPTQPVKQPEAGPKTTKPEKQKPIVDETSKKEKDSLLRIVKVLSESLASIRQKAASDETLHPHLAPLQQELDLLTAYVNRFDYERHLKYLAEKEFAGLKTKLRKMSSMLEEFDNNLVVPELTLRKPTDTKKDSYGAQVQQATSVLKEFKSYMSQAFSSDTIITDIENLFKKHDQEALTLKKQIEEQQKNAKEQVKKLSVTNTGRFAPIPKVTNQPIKQHTGSGSYNQGGGARGGYSSGQQGGMGQPQRPTGAQQQQQPKAGDKAKATDKPGEKGKDADSKTRGKKDEDFAEVPLTPEESLAKITKDLRSVNVQVAQNKEALNRIIDAMTAGTKPLLEDRNVLMSLTEKLSDTDKEITGYLTKLKKDYKEKNPALIAKIKKTLKDAFAADLNEVIAINEKFVTLAPMVGPFIQDTQTALDEAKRSIDEFKKHFAKIEDQISPPTRS